MNLTLLVRNAGPNQGKAIPIQRAQFLIGREAECHLRPANALVSNRHCALIRRQDKVFVRDLGSTNGTFVNDRQIKGEIELLDGDVLRVGPLVFTVRVEAVAPVNRPTPLPPTKETTQRVTAQTPAPVPAPSSEKPTDEEDAAALLLSLHDDENPSSGSGEGVPEGSTVYDLPSAGAAAAQDKEKEKPKSTGDTSSAAKTILEKYLKRPRNR